MKMVLTCMATVQWKGMYRSATFEPPVFLHGAFLETAMAGAYKRIFLACGVQRYVESGSHPRTP